MRFRANSGLTNLLFRDFRVIIRSYYGYTILKGSDGMLKRKIYDALVTWKNSSKGTTAMMIDGARRVGKSFIAEQFAKAEYKSYILIDFGRAPTDVLDLFVNDSADLDLFFAKLAAFYSTTLHKRESLILTCLHHLIPRIVEEESTHTTSKIWAVAFTPEYLYLGLLSPEYV